MKDNMKMKDDVKKNHRRIIAKALYSEILEYLDAHSGETFSKKELMGGSPFLFRIMRGR